MFWRRREGRNLFRPYELAVLDAVAAKLAPDPRLLLERQIAGTAHVQRLFEDTDVSLYPNRGRAQHHNPAIAFPNRGEDFKLATIQLRAGDRTGRAVVTAVLGHVFQITFVPAPRKLGNASALQVGKVTLHADPMRRDDGESVSTRLAALPPPIRRELERMWADGSADADGLMLAEDIYAVDLADGTYLMLGQLPDTTMLLARVEPPGGLRRFDADGELEGEHSTIAEATEAARSGL